MMRLKEARTSNSSSYMLKICEKMGASWSAQVFRQAGVTPVRPLRTDTNNYFESYMPQEN